MAGPSGGSESGYVRGWGWGPGHRGAGGCAVGWGSHGCPRRPDGPAAGRPRLLWPQEGWREAGVRAGVATRSPPAPWESRARTPC